MFCQIFTGAESEDEKMANRAQDDEKKSCFKHFHERIYLVGRVDAYRILNKSEPRNKEAGGSILGAYKHTQTHIN